MNGGIPVCRMFAAGNVKRLFATFGCTVLQSHQSCKMQKRVRNSLSLKLIKFALSSLINTRMLAISVPR